MALSTVLREFGHDVRHVREVGLRGQPDEFVFAMAQDMAAILITADLGFGDIRRYPLGSHCGVVVLRLPDYYRRDDIVELVRRFLESADLERMAGALVVVDPVRFRIRRK
ncbi:MAG: DUF5615 family PIN-like protein [Armatimonadetes bacterium]|nr:DUF5615 family PIN-like protein [Armatimonadota bacterium]